ncbi:transcriptional regulator BetI [Rahnella aceris]|uniref:transcriptional regulator BetI n=1 Tax=Rahnella sp. (strain Y9602) TaxID=2703885 RepID=UPI001C25250A|nr:transcriptional regulator BetI [Rahnella aceris]MBU9852950.1 transcriptional regulator BetI [Rahnella aceris]
MPKVGMQPIRRQQLIEATLAAVNEVGMHDASISQIARRAGVSNGIISHYFRDKNGLLEATMRYLLSHLGEGVQLRLSQMTDTAPTARLHAIAEANFDDSQTNSAAMKTWLAFWASSMHHPQLYRLQQVNSRRLYSNLCSEFRRFLPKNEARLAAQSTAALIDGLWLRGALSGKAFNRAEAMQITHRHIESQFAPRVVGQ